MTQNLTHLTDEGLVIDYTFWYDQGSRFQQEEFEVEIKKIVFEDVDVTNLLLNVADGYIDDLIERLEEFNRHG
tara:strand:+ start:1142 stop:1360 length:219 start_codon:yes stop_codon:yes gene_type:complete